MILLDVLVFFDLHTITNFQTLGSDVQSKMVQLLHRYFKQKHETNEVEIGLSHQLD